MDTNERGAVHVPPGEGERLWVAEESMTLVISGEDTGGKYALTDSTVPPQGEALPHIHRENEAFPTCKGNSKLRWAKTRSGRALGLSFTYLEVSSTLTRTSARRPQGS